MPLTCPQCRAEMHEVKAQAATGYWLVLDQCPRCGGVWCDRWELYPLTAAEAQRLDDADPSALSGPSPTAGATLRCPRCLARMAPFRDPALPADARVERCLNCEGLWLNRGELRRLKARGGAPTGTAPVADDATVERLARAAADPKSWPTVRNLDSAMSEAPVAETEDDVRSEVVTGAAWLILRALLRLLLHV